MATFEVCGLRKYAPPARIPDMDFDWRLFVAALGLAFVLEGAPYFLFAEKMPAVLAQLAENGPGKLRVMGLLVMLLGLGIVFLVRG